VNGGLSASWSGSPAVRRSPAAGEHLEADVVVKSRTGAKSGAFPSEQWRSRANVPGGMASGGQDVALSQVGGAEPAACLLD